MRRRSTWVMITVAMLIALAAGAAAAIGGSAKSTEGGWLYVVGAQSATTDGERLTLVGTNPTAVGFSDRPKRAFARVDVSDLVEQWDAIGFADEPPNAAISWFDDAGEHTIIVELSNPAIGADGITFDYAVLEKSPKRLRSRSADVQKTLPSEARDVVLFIDAVPTSVNDQITD